MDIQMRRILRRLYPTRSGNGHHLGAAPERRFLGRFVDRRLKQAGTRLRRVSKKRLAFTLILAVVALKAWGLIYYYNMFFSMRSQVEAARSQIGVQLQRRKDIVAQLNTIVLAYARHEKEIFEHAVDTRREIMRPAPVGSSPEAPASDPRLAMPSGTLDASLARVLAVAEGFPGLRLSENFQRLMDALVEVETKVAEQRMLLNGRSNDLATAINLFPAFVFNWSLRFEVPPFYEPDADVEAPVRLTVAPQAFGDAQRVESQGEGGDE